MSNVFDLDGNIIDGIDDLPDDIADDDYIPPDDDTPTYIKHAEFRAAVRHSRIMANGHMQITLLVPMEDKYLALPITDIPGTLLVMSVYRPVKNTLRPEVDDEK